MLPISDAGTLGGGGHSALRHRPGGGKGRRGGTRRNTCVHRSTGTLARSLARTHTHGGIYMQMLHIPFTTYHWKISERACRLLHTPPFATYHWNICLRDSLGMLLVPTQWLPWNSYHVVPSMFLTCYMPSSCGPLTRWGWTTFSSDVGVSTTSNGHSQVHRPKPQLGAPLCHLCRQRNHHNQTWTPIKPSPPTSNLGFLAIFSLQLS